MAQRVDQVVQRFPRYLEVYDQDVPFRGEEQYELHRRTIDLRREFLSVQAAIDDESFLSVLRATLRAWRLGDRASRLRPLDGFTASLRAQLPQLASLEHLRIDDPELDLPVVAEHLFALVSSLDVVDNEAKIVAGSKTLHHLLPELVPPMDRDWTGRFFGWHGNEWQYQQRSLFRTTFAAFSTIARSANPASFVGEGWRTSRTKVLDNAIIGFCKAEGIPRMR